MPESVPPDPQALSHFDEAGHAHMVDVSHKPETRRMAKASGLILMRPETLSLIQQGRADKGDVIGVAHIAAIQAAKRAADLIPLCHPLPLTKVTVQFEADALRNGLWCHAQVDTTGRTGVEIEALLAVQIGLLTVYDMCKAVDRGMVIEQVRLIEKTGGRSDWRHAPPT